MLADSQLEKLFGSGALLLGSGGGVGCFIRSDMDWLRRKDLEHDGIEAIWLEIFIKKSCLFLIGIIYRPPNTSLYLPVDFERIFYDMLDICMTECKETIIMGNLNVNYKKSSDNKEMKQIIKRQGLKQIIQEPTRITNNSSTLIDMIATTHEENVSKQITFASSISDHDLVGVIIKKNNHKLPHYIITKRNYANYNQQHFLDDLHKIQWQSITLVNDVNKAWDLFKKLFNSVIDKHVPYIEKKVKGRSCPWLTKDIKAKMNERDFHLRKARKSGTENNWSRYRRLRNTVTRMIRSSKSNYTRSILRESISRPSEFWNQIKRTFPTKPASNNNNTTFEINGKRTSDTKEIATGFCLEFFWEEIAESSSAVL